MKKNFIIFSFLIMGGCATTPDDYSNEYHEKAKNIILYNIKDKTKHKFEIIKYIKSNSCNSKSLNRFSGDWEEAKLLLRLEAASINADAVVDVKCWTNPVDMVSNCWASKRCEGNAVKIITP